MKYFVLAIILLIASCSGDDEPSDPIEGLVNIFKYDGKIYQSPGGAFDLYDKIGHDYYYYFLIGTSGQFEQNRNISEAHIAGDYIRVLLVADSLDRFYGEYEIAFNDLNIVSVDNKIDTIEVGRLVLKRGENEIKIIELRATSKSGKRLDLRAELITWTIAYKLSRTVEGHFSLSSMNYDISRAWANYKAEDAQMTIAFEDDNELFATQIAFVVNETDSILDQDYAVNNGYVSVYDYSKSERVYFSRFTNGTFGFFKNMNKYNIEFDITTSDGDVVKGVYNGAVEQ